MKQNILILFENYVTGCIEFKITNSLPTNLQRSPTTGRRSFVYVAQYFKYFFEVRKIVWW